MIPFGCNKLYTCWVTYIFSIPALSFILPERHITCVDDCIIWNGVIKVVYEVVLFEVAVTFHFD